MDQSSTNPTNSSLKAPGTALLVFAIVQELVLVVALAMFLIKGMPESGAAADDYLAQVLAKIGAGLAIGWMLFGFVVTPITMLGALRMRSGKRGVLPIVGAIVALIPFHCSCVIGMPLAIWAFIALLRSGSNAPKA